MIILDTNVLSALMAPKFNPAPIIWLNRQAEPSIWTTAVTLYESRAGIAILPEGKRRRDLHDRLDGLIVDLLGGRVLPFDQEAAECAAQISSRRIRVGLNIGSRDTQIAGIATARRATLATRNVKDFADLDVPLINPWDG